MARVGMDFITIAWDPPVEPNIQILQYEIVRTIKNQRDNASRETTTRQNYTFAGLAQQTEYLFQVIYHSCPKCQHELVISDTLCVTFLISDDA